MTNEQDTPQVAPGMFSVPLGSMGGALVPYASGASPLTASPQSIFRLAIHLPGAAPTPTEDEPASSLPTGQQRPELAATEAIAAERDRLLGLCRSLNRAGKCPGRCVFTGELRNSGTSVFRELTGDST